MFVSKVAEHHDDERMTMLNGIAEALWMGLVAYEGLAAYIVSHRAEEACLEVASLREHSRDKEDMKYDDSEDEVEENDNNKESDNSRVDIGVHISCPT